MLFQNFKVFGLVFLKADGSQILHAATATKQT